jgi:ABC-type multidrug transport system fused ATPase/permease subunit
VQTLRGGLQRLVPGLGRAIALAGLLSVVRSPVFVAVPWSVRRIFDDAIPHRDGGQIVELGLAMLALYLLDALVLHTLRRRAARFATEAVAEVRQALAVRLHALPRTWHDSQDPGLQLGVLVQDTERLLIVVSQLLGWVVPTVVTFFALAAVATVVAPQLAAVVGLAVLLVLVAVVPLARTTVGHGRASADALRRFSARWRTTLRLLPATQAHGAADVVLARRQRDVTDARATALQLRYTQSRMIGALDLAAAVLAAATLVVGGLGITHGWLSVGSMLSFYAVGLLLLRQLSSAAPGVASGLSDASSIWRLVELLDTQAQPPYTGTRVHVPQGGVELRGVSFSYDATQPVLQDLDLKIAPGEHVAIFGPIGAGKSTLISLLLGLHAPQQGTVLIDDIPMSELDIAGLRQGIGFASQDPVLFAGTIAENIAFARSEASAEDVARAALLSTVAQFAETLPGGLETPIGDEGVRLSGGQRQCVALARALVGAPRLVILDEPTTYLDSAVIDDLLRRLDQLPASPTIVTITHDPRIADYADRVVHLRVGRIELVRPGSAQGRRTQAGTPSQ